MKVDENKNYSSILKFFSCCEICTMNKSFSEMPPFYVTVTFLIADNDDRWNHVTTCTAGRINATRLHLEYQFSWNGDGIMSPLVRPEESMPRDYINLEYQFSWHYYLNKLHVSKTIFHHVRSLNLINLTLLCSTSFHSKDFYWKLHKIYCILNGNLELNSQKDFTCFNSKCVLLSRLIRCVSNDAVNWLSMKISLPLLNYKRSKNSKKLKYLL